MKKFISLIILLFGLVFVGCGAQNKETIKVIVPSGTPLVAIGGVLGNEYYDVEVVSGADLLTQALVKGEYDVVIAPVTAASKLYIAQNIKYRFASSINLSSNYLITLNKKKLTDSGEKKILAYGANNTPDIIMKSVLAKNGGVDAYTIDYQQAITDVVPFIVNGSDYDFFLTSEPVLTQLKLKYNLDFEVIDLQEELKDDLEIIPQAGIFVNSESLKQKEIKNFLKDVKKNIESLNKTPSSYYDKVSSLNEYFTKLGKDILEASIPRSNIKYIEAKNNIEVFNKYYDLLNKYNSKLLNGAKPDENFYY